MNQNDLGNNDGEYHGIIDFLHKYFNKWSYGGTLIFGSKVEKTGRIPKDIDVVVLNLGNEWFTGILSFKKIKLEIFCRPLAKVCASIIAYRDFFDTRNIAAGRLIDWNIQPPFFKYIKRLAEINWAMGPPRIRQSTHFFTRARCENMVSEIRTRARDEVTKRFLLAWSIDHVIADYYRLYCLYLPKWSYLMGYLKERNADMHQLAVDFLMNHDPDRKFEYLEKIIGNVIEPFGGFPAREWKVVVDEEWVEEKKEGSWEKVELPDIEKIQPMKDAYCIGLNEHTKQGQTDLPVPPEYECHKNPYYYWEHGVELPYHNETIKKVVAELSTDSGVHGIIVFGSFGLGWAKPDSDVDMYIVRERPGKVLERKFVDGAEFGLEFVNFTDVYRGILMRRNTSYWRNFKESKVLFARHPDIFFMVEIATMLFEAGMPALPPDTVILYRKKLQHVLEDGAELIAKGDTVSALYNDNLLFCLTIQKWFRLHNWLDTKRTYIMKEIKEKDEYLYDLVCKYLMESDAGEKHHYLEKMIKYVLEPFGGFLPEEWSIPVVPHEVRDEELTQFLEDQGITIEKELAKD